MPTWYVDIKLPLLQERYYLEGMIDSVQIFPTPDSIGMQLVFEDSLPTTSIDSDWLEVGVNQSIEFETRPDSTPELSVDVTFDTSFTIPLGNSLIDIFGIPFSAPPVDTVRRIYAQDWNTIVQNTPDIEIEITIDLPEISQNDLPDFVTSVDGFIISDTTENGNSSKFQTNIINNGLPTPLVNISFELLTGENMNSPDTLADHSQDTLRKGNYQKVTFLVGDTLNKALKMVYKFGLSKYEGPDTVLTIDTTDFVQIVVEIIWLNIGVDSAVVTIAETELPTELDPISFPSDIEIFSGVFKTETQPDVNEISISNLKSTFPFDIDYYMNFRNFSDGSDSVQVPLRLLTSTAFDTAFKIDGYTFANPAGEDSALKELTVDISAVLRAQQALIPLDGSELGRMSIDVDISDLYFESLEATIIEEFPPSEQSIEGIPQGFDGMAFTNAMIEFEMWNTIALPIILDLDLVGINSLGDSAIVGVLASISEVNTDNPDTTKTIIRLSKLGTTTLKYASLMATQWIDSVTVPPATGESTIVELLSFNPAFINVESAARIDGRGEIIPGAGIGGVYRMVAPFEVRMDPMTFIPVTKTPIDEIEHSTRNRIRNTLAHAELTTHVINSIVDGELSILHSNSIFFPLDTTTEMLAIYRDTLIAHGDLFAGEDLYIITNCEAMNLDSGNVYIFNVMDDFRKCIDGLVYLVKNSPGSDIDTVVSYIDTLTTIILPKPTRFYGTAPPVYGSASAPGDTTHTSIISAENIRLLTDFGDHFVVPRFRLNGDTLAFLSISDNIDVTSTITFRISSTGMLEESTDEIVITYPNGGETLTKGTPHVIRWKTFGTISNIGIEYFYPDTSLQLIGDGIFDTVATISTMTISSDTANVDSFLWTTPDTEQGEIRLRITDVNSTVSDTSGWFFKIE
ncbi:MAG TPA: hypothetical protein EYN02_01210 [Candidatus Marinimicrobia bacterium]|nr:hypothetical protein [Candidatus Neomarinimicrobiota bacterium]